MASANSYQDRVQHAVDLKEATTLLDPPYQPADEKFTLAKLTAAKEAHVRRQSAIHGHLMDTADEFRRSLLGSLRSETRACERTDRNVYLAASRCALCVVSRACYRRLWIVSRRANVRRI